MKNHNHKNHIKKKSAIAAFFFLLSKILPSTIIKGMGGPAAAGMLVAVLGAIAVGVPTAYISSKAISQTKFVQRRDQAFQRFFGAAQGATDDLASAESQRMANLENEEEHLDEDSSLGLIIPGEAPSDSVIARSEATRQSQENKANPSVIARSEATRQSQENVKQSYFSPSPSRGEGWGEGALGKQSIYGAGSTGASTGGATARNKKAAVSISNKPNFGAGGSATQDLVRGAKIARVINKGYTSRDMAVSLSNDAFKQGQGGDTAKIIGGPQGSVVGGVNNAGTMTDPSQRLARSVPAPQTQNVGQPQKPGPTPDQPGEVPVWLKVVGAIIGLIIGLILANFIAAWLSQFLKGNGPGAVLAGLGGLVLLGGMTAGFIAVSALIAENWDKLGIAGQIAVGGLMLAAGVLAADAVAAFFTGQPFSLSNKVPGLFGSNPEDEWIPWDSSKPAVPPPTTDFGNKKGTTPEGKIFDEELGK